MKRTVTRTRRAGIAALATASILGLTATAAVAIVATPPASTIYDSLSGVSETSYPSLGFQARSTDELGDQVNFAGTDRMLDTVTFSMTNWACETGGGVTCVTSPSSSYSYPITVTVYEVDNSGAVPAPGPVVATVTQSVDIPFRPSADATNCTGSDAGKWFDGSRCNNGYAFDAEVQFPADTYRLPDSAIISIKYDTSTDNNALGTGHPVDSLNVSLVSELPTVGSVADADTIFQDSTWNGAYEGADKSTGVFRQDTGWTGYAPFGIKVTATPEQGVPASTTFALGEMQFSVSGMRSFDATGEFATNKVFIADPSTVGSAPAGVSTPFGAGAFELDVFPGSSVTVVMTLPSPVTGLLKSTGGAWSEYDATISGTTVTFTLTDGGAGDADATVNGTIVDPVAAGVGAAFTG